MDAQGNFVLAAKPEAAGGSGGGADGRRGSGWLALKGAVHDQNVGENAMEALQQGHKEPTNFVRRMCWRLAKTRGFNAVILLTIGANALVMAMEVPRLPAATATLMGNLELIFNVVFTIELVIKLVAFGCCASQDAYFRSAWNALDCLIVICGWLTIVLAALRLDELGSVKLLRLFRVLRPLRSMTVVPMLRNIINAIFAAVRDLGNNMLLIMFFLAMFAIFYVSLLSSALRRRCATTSPELRLPEGRRVRRARVPGELDVRRRGGERRERDFVPHQRGAARVQGRRVPGVAQPAVGEP